LPRGLNHPQDANRRISRSRQGLGDPEVSSLVVEQENVGEGATDVDADTIVRIVAVFGMHRVPIVTLLL
jgi:hypothetical protein